MNAQLQSLISSELAICSILVSHHVGVSPFFESKCNYFYDILFQELVSTFSSWKKSLLKTFSRFMSCFGRNVTQHLYWISEGSFFLYSGKRLIARGIRRELLVSGNLCFLSETSICFKRKKKQAYSWWEHTNSPAKDYVYVSLFAS